MLANALDPPVFPKVSQIIFGQSCLSLPPTTQRLLTLQVKSHFAPGMKYTGHILEQSSNSQDCPKTSSSLDALLSNGTARGINIARAVWRWSRKKMYVLQKKKLAQGLGNPIIRSTLILTASKDPTPTSMQPGEGSEKSTPSLVF